MTLLGVVCLVAGSGLGIAGWVVVLRANCDVRWPLLLPRGGLHRPRVGNVLTASAVALVALALLPAEPAAALPVLFWYSLGMLTVLTALQVVHAVLHVRRSDGSRGSTGAW